MPTTTSFVYGAADRAFERPVRLSGLAISPSLDDLSFLESRFKEAHWNLYIAGRYERSWPS
jgi:hypothetical protein